jgi:hypothetical protein
MKRGGFFCHQFFCPQVNSLATDNLLAAAKPRNHSAEK